MTTQIVGKPQNQPYIKPVKADYGDALRLARRMYAAVGICIEHEGDRRAAEYGLASLLFYDLPGSALYKARQAALR